MAIFRQLARAITTGGLTLLLLPAAQMQAQTFPGRLHRPPAEPGQSAPAPQSSATAASPQPQPAPPSAQLPPSMLQQPAREAQILFAGDTLSIHADNSSLSGILHEFAAKSGMQIDGLSNDERVFGSFGPGAPRDVLADLLNGTAYDVLMVGDLSNGAPRELVLSPSLSGAPATPASSPSTPEEPDNDVESADSPPPAAETPPAPTNTPPSTPGVKTPQQLFEQLQRMRQAEQQQQQQPQ